MKAYHLFTPKGYKVGKKEGYTTLQGCFNAAKRLTNKSYKGILMPVSEALDYGYFYGFLPIGFESSKTVAIKSFY